PCAPAGGPPARYAVVARPPPSPNSAANPGNARAPEREGPSRKRGGGVPRGAADPAGGPEPARLIVPLLVCSMRVIPRRGAHIMARRVAVSTTLPGWVTDYARKITVRCTTKLIAVATPCATTKAQVNSP